MVKCRSLVPLGACSAGAASVTPPPTTTSSVPPLERTISVLPAGTGSGPLAGARGFLVGGRQDDRRLAGIDRRRHPGIDPDIGRRQHAVPVEGRGDAHACARRPRRHRSRPSSPRPARAAPRDRGSASRGDGRPARMRLIEASVRSRCACHSASATGSWVASVSVSAVAGRWRMPVPRSSRLSPSSRVGQRKRTSGNSAPSASSSEQAEADGARNERQRQPQSGPGHHQKQSDDGQQPRQMRPGALPRDRIFGPLQGLRQLQPRDGVGSRAALTGRDGAVQQLSGLPKMPTTTAA